jgi:hypothetical protein
MNSNSHFEDLKKKKIQELDIQYKKNVNQTIKYYVNIINHLSRSKKNNKFELIESVKNTLQSKLTFLHNLHITQIAKIHSISPPTIISISQEKRKKALLIGINYKNTQNELQGCIHDMESFQERLIQKGFYEITLLTDDTTIKPTKDVILNELKNLFINSNPGDLLFFAFSGHGSYQPDTNHDETNGFDELLIPIDMQPIVDDDLKILIQTYLKKEVTLFAISDSCFSGTVMDLKYQYLDSINEDKLTEHQHSQETEGNILFISGCTDTQTSADAYIQNSFHGAMTWSLLESLKTKPEQSWRELIVNMRELLKTNGYSQIPQLSSGKFIDIDSTVFV